MSQVTVNFWAILVAALSSMVLGALWYSPLLLGNKWVKLMGWTHEDMEKHKKECMRGYLVTLVASLITAYVLSHFVDYAGATTLSEGAQAGFWIWLGFIATYALGSVLWEGKRFSLYLVNVGFNLLALIVMGMILAVWQ